MLTVVCFAFFLIGCTTACLPEYKKDLSMEDYNNIRPPPNPDDDPDDDSTETPEWFHFPGISGIPDLRSWLFSIDGSEFACHGVFQDAVIFYTSEGPFRLETISLGYLFSDENKLWLYVNFMSVIASPTNPQHTRLTVMSRAYEPPLEADDMEDASANAVFVSLPSNRNAGQLTIFAIRWIRKLLRGSLKPKYLCTTIEEDNVVTISYVGVPAVVTFF